jgi:hypothetical protein
MKILSVGVEFHADGRTDMTKLMAAFRNFVNGPENWCNFVKYLEYFFTDSHLQISSPCLTQAYFWQHLVTTKVCLWRIQQFECITHLSWSLNLSVWSLRCIVECKEEATYLWLYCYPQWAGFLTGERLQCQWVHGPHRLPSVVINLSIPRDLS